MSICAHFKQMSLQHLLVFFIAGDEDDLIAFGEFREQALGRRVVFSFCACGQIKDAYLRGRRLPGNTHPFHMNLSVLSEMPQRLRRPVT